MTKTIVMHKHGVGVSARLVPADDDAAEVLANIPDGTRIGVEIRRPRSLTNLAKWWQLMTILANNMPDVVDDKRIIVDKRAVSDMVLVAIGECDWRFKIETGEMWPQARSIAFENLEEDHFIRVWKRAVYYVEANWLPIGSDKLQREVDRFFHRDGAVESLGERVARAA